MTTFDLAINTPFRINFILTLRHHHPITFWMRDTQFFKYPLDSPGLEFTNIRSKEAQAGMRVQICYIGANDSDLPAEADKKDCITLLPNQPYTLEVSIEPMSDQGRMGTFAEIESGSDKSSPNM